MIYHVTIGGRTFEVELGAGGVSVDGEEVEADFARIDGSPVRSLVLDGRSHRLAAARVARETWEVHLGGARLRAQVVDERTRAIRQMTRASSGSHGPEPIRAPMPGMVVKVEVAEDDVVHAGQGLVIVEAMKMENELKAGAGARVKRIHVEEGDAVEKDELLIDLAPLEDEAS